MGLPYSVCNAMIGAFFGRISGMTDIMNDTLFAQCPCCNRIVDGDIGAENIVTCNHCAATLRVHREEGFDGGLYRFIWLERAGLWARLKAFLEIMS
jgi:hypothetical protein